MSQETGLAHSGHNTDEIIGICIYTLSAWFCNFNPETTMDMLNEVYSALIEISSRYNLTLDDLTRSTWKDTMTNNYRIRRIDLNNIAIQRRVATRDGNKRWLTISYHGHNLNSLISGLFDLIMREYTPEQEKLSDTLTDLQLELVSGLERIEKIIDEAKLLDR